MYLFFERESEKRKTTPRAFALEAMFATLTQYIFFYSRSSIIGMEATARIYAFAVRLFTFEEKTGGRELHKCNVNKVFPQSRFKNDKAFMSLQAENYRRLEIKTKPKSKTTF